MDKIDFVVTWVDASDSQWQEQLACYRKTDKGDKAKARFRDMDIFRYWFRAVERYAPWVNKVYLITNGKNPAWLNLNHPKLVTVSHSDYMPEECLPTFNSCAIELYMNRIKGLAEQFVYFNDDMLLNGPVAPDYFFRKGLPCDYNKETCFNVPIYTPTERFNITMSMLADLGLVNAHFDRWETVQASPWRWFGPHLGWKGLLMSSILMKQRLFVGFSNYHTEQALLKSTLDEVWQTEPGFLRASCTRFREEVIAGPYLFRYWQFAQNRFYPKKRSFACFQIVKKEIIKDIRKALFNEKISSVCLNDTPFCNEADFGLVKAELVSMFEEKFPEKSSFETDL